MRRTIITIMAGSALAFAPAAAIGQAPGVPIEEHAPISRNEQILAAAAKLREAGGLMAGVEVAAQLVSPKGGKFELAEPQNRPLTGREVARRAREAYARVGWYYRCKKCDKWHLNFAGGYAIAPDVLVTCHHSLVPQSDMREAFLIALNRQNEVVPITAILARSAAMDCAILQVKGGGFPPLALRDDVAPGDRVSCFSEPLAQTGYFSNGIINRFFWNAGRRGTPGTLQEFEHLRVNVSTDWAPGSSGAAVLDEYGNAIGHVARVAPLTIGRGADASAPPPVKDALAVGDETPKKTAPSRQDSVVITLHEAIPARSIRALALDAAKGTAPPAAGPASGSESPAK